MSRFTFDVQSLDFTNFDTIPFDVNVLLRLVEEALGTPLSGPRTVCCHRRFAMASLMLGILLC